MKKRVVVSGLGIIAPSGIGLDAFWRNISRGVSVTKKVTNFDVSPFHSQVAAQVEDFVPQQFCLDEKTARRMDRYVRRMGGGTMRCVFGQITKSGQ